MRKYIMLIISLINAAAMAAVIAMSETDIVPTHYNISGSADRYSSKWTFMLAAAIPIAIALIFLIYRRLNNPNVQSNVKYESKAIAFIMMFFVVLCWIMTIPSLKGAESLGSYVPATVCIIIGILMMYVSNLMAKIKQNRTFGIKTKATLSNETVWRKTHRLSGYTGMSGGLILAVCGIITLGTANTALLVYAVIIFIALEFVIPVAYANRLYKKLEGK